MPSIDTWAKARWRRNRRALKVLNGLYNSHAYLPLVRGSRAPRLVACFDIILVPLEDGCRPVMARVETHPDSFPARKGSELFESFGMVRSWLTKAFPEEIAGRAGSPVDVWLFAYVKAKTVAEDMPRPGDPASLLCGWQFNWSAGTFWHEPEHYWSGKHAKRVRLARRWSRAPQRHIARAEAMGIMPRRFQPKRPR